MDLDDLISALGNATFENYVGATTGFSEIAYQFSSHVLTFGFAVMLAALLYFVLTIKTVAPKYRISSVLSVVVMVSAFLLLMIQQQNWTNAMVYDLEAGRYMLGDGRDLFNNGYRYLNWLIDVPMLLFQILFVVTLTTSKFSSVRNGFWISGSLMILTGYYGQYFEVTSPGTFFFWGIVSTLFFIHILYLMRKVIKEGQVGAPPKAQQYLGMIWLVFLFSWMLYPIAYVMPYIFGITEAALNEWAVMLRHVTYTVADIASKVIYGILLTLTAQEMSKADGYDYEKMENAI